jgi:hypothetical protein
MTIKTEKYGWHQFKRRQQYRENNDADGSNRLQIIKSLHQGRPRLDLAGMMATFQLAD